MTTGKSRWVLPLLSATLLLGVYGCDGTATVTGKVSYQGRPVTYGSILFLSSDRTSRSGVLEADGSYTVERVHPGEVRIGVISHDPSKVLRSGKPAHRGEKGIAAAKKALKTWFPLPRKFEDPDTSGVGCSLDPGHVNYDVELK
jgi:hypothetical protein